MTCKEYNICYVICKILTNKQTRLISITKKKNHARNVTQMLLFYEIMISRKVLGDKEVTF